MKRALKKRYATGLAAIRHQHGYSQAAFAQLLGVSKSVLSMAECGLRSLPSSILFKITDLELERLQAAATSPAAEPAPVSLPLPAVYQPPSTYLFTNKPMIMNYEVGLLTTRADCRVLIDNAVSEKESLEYRKSGLIRNRKSAVENSVSVRPTCRQPWPKWPPAKPSTTACPKAMPNKRPSAG